MLYVGHDFFGRYGSALPPDRPLWVRRLVLRPTTPGWDLWQASHRARVHDGADNAASTVV